MTTRKPRYVFDTNTLISAALFEGSTPDRAFRWALRHGRVLASPDTLDELVEVLGRDKFDRYLSAEEREAFLEALVERADVVEPVKKIRACRDPDDDKFLELAVEGRAEAIVSGDDDLLALDPFRHISIVTPSAFLEQQQET
jgi:putative PIN family toxin of toxin-antitoxin system